MKIFLVKKYIISFMKKLFGVQKFPWGAKCDPILTIFGTKQKFLHPKKVFLERKLYFFTPKKFKKATGISFLRAIVGSEIEVFITNGKSCDKNNSQTCGFFAHFL